jgi:hypothetical protein
MVLTDEQVAEGLRAKEIVTRWASWIEEVSQEMEPDPEGSGRLVRDRAFLESILERLQAAEAERDKARAEFAARNATVLESNRLARQQVRREAFEEAAKLVDSAEIVKVLGDADEYVEDARWSLKTAAEAIRALAEGER